MSSSQIVDNIVKDAVHGPEGLTYTPDLDSSCCPNYIHLAHFYVVFLCVLVCFLKTQAGQKEG